MSSINEEEENSAKTPCLPSSFRNFLSKTGNVIKFAFNIVCDASFVFFASGLVLFGPVMFEMERMRIESSNNDNKKSSQNEEKGKEI